MKQNGLILFIIILLLVFMLPTTVLAKEQPAKIADVALKNVLRGMLNKGVYDEIYPSELEQFTGEMDFSDMGITDLRGLENLTNVTSFNFSHNAIFRLPTHLAKMGNLEVLDLSFNNIYKLPASIADARSLRVLNLAGNKLKVLPVRIQEMKNLKVLDISGNRFEELPNRLHYLHFDEFNCNFNFIDFSESTISRKELDRMEVTGNKQAFKQLLRLPKITYVTDNGNLIIKWRTMGDVPFYDGTSAIVVGYTVLLDGKFKGTVGPDETELDIGSVDSGTYSVGVSPDYKLDGFGEFALRSFTNLDGVVYGKDGPYIPENPEPVVFKLPASESVSTGQQEADTMVVLQNESNATGVFTDMTVVTWILLAAVILLAGGLTTMVVLFLRKKTDKEDK